jgi:hypothetical protein
MLKSQLKGVPESEQEKILTAFENNPQLFENIAKEVQAKIAEGKDQTAAAMEVMTKYQNELRGIMK